MLKKEDATHPQWWHECRHAQTCRVITDSWEGAMIRCRQPPEALCSVSMHMGIHYTRTLPAGGESSHPTPSLWKARGVPSQSPNRIPRPNPEKLHTTHGQGHRTFLGGLCTLPALPNSNIPSHPEPKYNKPQTVLAQGHTIGISPTWTSAFYMDTPSTQSSTTRYTWHQDAHKRAVGPLHLCHRPSEPLQGAGF